jgi:uncharacterized RDD family membrane protein YckC
LADASAFLATPRKRLAAAFVDFLLVCLGALLTYASADALGHRLRFEIVVVVAYFAYHAGFLYLWTGQSPGRRTFDISVVSAHGGDLRLWQALARSLTRPAVIIAASAVPVLPFSRTISDVQAAAAVLLLELGLLLSLSSRKTGADMVSGTVVVNTPPPQPHRAPAVPMYSASDAEFGYPPRKPKRTEMTSTPAAQSDAFRPALNAPTPSAPGCER